jgi:hypothetical protein
VAAAAVAAEEVAAVNLAAEVVVVDMYGRHAQSTV